MPVYQAVRPWSRALSVHQGKGLTRQTAMIGALMEGVESHCAEIFKPELVFAPYNGLPSVRRVPFLSDFALDRANPPDPTKSLEWVAARRLIDGSQIMAPFEFVSLDCTRRGDPLLEKSSVGLAAHFHRDQSSLTAVLELIERDAEWDWRFQPIERRSGYRLDVHSIPFEWFKALRGDIVRANLRLGVYLIPAVVALPVVVCEISEPLAGAASRQLVYGSAAHPMAEAALRGSLVEAVQSRVTLIAGVRDDIFYPEIRGDEAESIGLTLPPPPGFRSRNWNEATREFDRTAPTTPIDLAIMMADAGYPDTAVIDLSPPGMDAVVTKAFTPGLGAFARRRRSLSPT